MLPSLSYVTRLRTLVHSEINAVSIIWNTHRRHLCPRRPDPFNIAGVRGIGLELLGPILRGASGEVFDALTVRDMDISLDGL
jgi:hypothetical protein